MTLETAFDLPFWFELFTRLNFRVVLSPQSSRKLYLKGQRTIPSDTVCYPAKLLHGHVEALVEEGVDAIWYPCMSYNNDEGIGDNHYNCPVVAYYPDLLGVNIPALGQVNYLHPNLGLHRPKDFEKKGAQFLQEAFSDALSSALQADGQQPTEEEMTQQYLQTLTDLLNQEELDTRTTTVEVPLTLVDGQWKITPDEAVVDALLGGLLTTGEALTSLLEESAA